MIHFIKIKKHPLVALSDKITLEATNISQALGEITNGTKYNLNYVLFNSVDFVIMLEKKIDLSGYKIYRLKFDPSKNGKYILHVG